MKKKLEHVLLFALCFFPFPSHAAQTAVQVQPKCQYGISMHGDLKYKPGEPFGYVRPDAPRGGTLRLGVTGTFDSLNPFVARGTSPAGLSVFSERLVFETLMKRSADEPFSLYPLIAESIEVAPDRSWVVFHLNPLAKWADGKPVTPGDVIFSWKLLRDTGRPNMRLFYARIASIKQQGTTNSVRFTFKKIEGKDESDPELPLLAGLMPILPRHLLENRDFERLTMEPVTGSGPYRIRSVSPGKSIVYERRPDYWGRDLAVNAGQYNFDVIRYDYYRDPHVAFEAFKAGEYDAHVEGNIARWHTGYDFPAVRSGQIKRMELPVARSVGFHAFVFNTRRPLFSDIRVRKALGLAFDFNWLNQNLFYGDCIRSRSYFQCTEMASQGKPQGKEMELLEPFRANVSAEVFEDAWAPPSASNPREMRRNILQSRKLLQDAGWQVDARGVLRNEKQEPFRFEVLIYNPDDEKIVLALARNLKMLGISVVCRMADTAQYEARCMAFDFDMIIRTWFNTESPGNEQSFYWSSDAADEKGSRNYPGIRDAAVDAMCRTIANARDRKTLVAAARALDRLLLSGYYVIPLYHREKVYFSCRREIGYPPINPRTGLLMATWWSSEKESGTVMRPNPER